MEQIAALSPSRISVKIVIDARSTFGSSSDHSTPASLIRANNSDPPDFDVSVQRESYMKPSSVKVSDVLIKAKSADSTHYAEPSISVLRLSSKSTRVSIPSYTPSLLSSASTVFATSLTENLSPSTSICLCPCEFRAAIIFASRLMRIWLISDCAMSR